MQELFERAYENALEQPRTFDLLVLAKHPDRNEIAKLFMIDDKVPIREYVPFRNKLETAHTGLESDLFMASVAGYIHPELQSEYSGIDFEDLDPVKVFGIQFPETVDEVRLRLGYDDGFTEAINNINEQDNTQTL